MAVVAAMMLALATFTVFAGFTPIIPTTNVVAAILLGDVLVVLTLIILIVVELVRLRRARAAARAGARLHARVIALFSLVAAVPAIVTAVVATVAVEWTLKPEVMNEITGYIQQSADANHVYQEFQCHALLEDAGHAASAISRALSTSPDSAEILGASLDAASVEFNLRLAAVVTDPRLGVIGQPARQVRAVRTGADPAEVGTPSAKDFAEARQGLSSCLVAKGQQFVALRPIEALPDSYLYAARPIHPGSIDVAVKAGEFSKLFDRFLESRRRIELGYAAVFVLLALTMLFSAIWLGLTFANQLVTPIRRLIRAADEVASGNLSVQVPERKSEGDIGHLSQTFNKMTQELRQQRRRLTQANALAEERRAFIEAALAGVPAGVLGVDASGSVTVTNDAAQRLIGGDAALVGRPVAAASPQLAQIVDDARVARQRLYAGQFTVLRDGRERILNVRVTTDPKRVERGAVVTLDDITDLVTAQRTAAWADVARRIAHEIKNPLTPIQLSAERLKRRYGKMIVEGKDVFDQCTDTIVRQVDDIKRMVDEFSSFARMPRALPAQDDLRDCVRQAVFLARVGRADVVFDERLPADALEGEFDRRLLSQALTNVLKNAGEGIDARGAGDSPLVVVSLSVEDTTAVIAVSDNGKGFPAEDRHRLLEPYVTTRAEGTGLGLPIVKKICEDHKGSLDLRDGLPRSDGGFGAQVIMRLPLRQDPDAASPRTTVQTAS